MFFVFIIQGSFVKTQTQIWKIFWNSWITSTIRANIVEEEFWFVDWSWPTQRDQCRVLTVLLPKRKTNHLHKTNRRNNLGKSRWFFSSPSANFKLKSSLKQRKNMNRRMTTIEGKLDSSIFGRVYVHNVGSLKVGFFNQ